MVARVNNVKELRRLLSQERLLARSLHGRMYASDKLYLVSGKPDPKKLFATLSYDWQNGGAKTLWNPLELGFPISWDGEVQAATLDAIRQGLARWAKELAKVAASDVTSRVRREVEKEQQELERLFGRLIACQDGQQQLVDGIEFPSPFMLDDEEELALQEIILDGHGAKFGWLARIVAWVAGPRAAKRFLKAAAELFDTVVSREKIFRAEEAAAIAALATLAACDGSKAPLPVKPFAIAIEKGQINAIKAAFEALLERAQQKGYDGLLRFLGNSEQPPIRPYEFVPLTTLFGLEAKEEQVRWARDQCLHIALAASEISPERIYKAGRSMEASHGERASQLILELSNSVADVDVIRAWLDWLAPLTTATVSTQLNKMMENLLENCVVIALRDLKLHAVILAWIEACSVEEGSSAWLARLARCRAHVGWRTTMPKSVRKLLTTAYAIGQELDWLERELAAGRGNANLARRYESLLRRREQPEINNARIDRAAEEAFLIGTVEVLREMLRRELERIWETQCARPASEVSFSTLLCFARWYAPMGPPERKLAEKLRAAHTVHGAQYKQHLAANHDWLVRAAQQGIDVQSWLAEQSTMCEVGGRQFELCLSVDPQEIFLMGKYFDTCLAPGGANQYAVIANAHDANKQVVYMYERRPGRATRGRPIARMLLAVDTNFQLIRFNAYGPSPADLQPLENEILQTMIDYAARRARQAGIALTNEGHPESLGNHFWYNDGNDEWPAHARATWEAAGVVRTEEEPALMS